MRRGVLRERCHTRKEWSTVPGYERAQGGPSVWSGGEEAA